MKKEKIKNLEKRGWKVGSVSDFLKLSREEEEYIEMKVALSSYFRQLRKEKTSPRCRLQKKSSQVSHGWQRLNGLKHLYPLTS